ncbi:MAG: DEAD/DEAH box helicase [Methanobacterium sp.]|nr:DEAD/DEAH box helicase [Methanobacterium sp.]
MIILRKNKKILEIFPIGSAKDALNTRRKPLFYGYLKLKRIGDKIRPYKFIVKKDSENETLLPPGEALKILRKQNVYIIGEDPETEEMLNSLDIPFKRTLMCRHCTFEGFITLIRRNSSYKYHKEYICRKCAEQEIKREMKSRSFDKCTFNNFKRILDETGDLQMVLTMFDPRFNPVKNPNLTLYDKISTDDNKNIPKINMDDLKIPMELKKILKGHGKYLLTVQALTLDNGLLEGENLLVVSATASGKTLIGELAGVPKAMNGEKFIFLTPLVALANQKYRDFKKKYKKLGLKVSIRVGMSRINAKEELPIHDGRVNNAEIIVGTYEGLDFLLRSGKSSELGKLGTVVVDEIHMLDDEERGPRLKGLIKRLQTLFPDLQIIGLSATIKNQQEIADKFKMKLVEYNKRPVPLERHLIFTRSEHDKMDLITQLTRQEYKNISAKGFKGQTIIFTNSRRKTHSITNYLVKRGVNTASYHAGLSYAKKNRIEKDFLKQEISAVVTTAALAAGVDFPASQVIFETLTMGNRWLTPNEFSQMLGRAGRPSYHDLGKVYLIPEIGLKYDDETEDMRAVTLLESDVEPINVYYTDDAVVEQVLSDLCSKIARNINTLKKLYKNEDIPMDIDQISNLLLEYGLAMEKNDSILPTKYGCAVSMSFLNYNDADYIKKSIRSAKIINPLDIAMGLQPFENAYLSSRVSQKIAQALKTNISSRLFADSTLDILCSGDAISKLEPSFQELLINLQMEFMACKCKDRPYCNCFQEELSAKMLKYRMLKYDPADISKKLLKDYGIHAYAGDIFSWLDSIIRALESVRRIANAFNKIKLVKECNYLIKKIEN